MSDYQREIDVAIAAAREAGEVAQRRFGSVLDVEDKPDGQGPVSEVDRACDTLLRKRLADAFPKDALLSEETHDDGAWHHAARVWMVDPIDGTQEYIEGIDQYAIMIGLCEAGQPVLGAVFAPAQDVLIYGVVGEGAALIHGGETSSIAVATSRPGAGWRLAVSRSHPSAKVDQICARLGDVQQRKIGSVGLKIAAVVRNEADMYLAGTGRIKLWDTCGPHAVLAAGGGALVDLFGQPLDYRETLTHPHGLLACSTAYLDELTRATQPLAVEFFGAHQPA